MFYKKCKTSVVRSRASASAILQPAVFALLICTAQALQELEKGCELFPETVTAKVRKLYEHTDAIESATRLNKLKIL